MTNAKVTTVPITDQQHLLFLFIPLKKGTVKQAKETVDKINAEAAQLHATAPGFDIRKTTGVHYFMTYTQADGEATKGIPVPGFTSFPGKDVLVVMSIYDGQFDAYINAFFQIPQVVMGLNLLMGLMDETGIDKVDPNGPTSAKYISENGGIVKNAAAFYCLLMRYNFGDPVFCFGQQGGKFVLGTNFPGLTVAKIIDNYPGAAENWPAAGGVTFEFPESDKPDCE